MLLMQGCYAAVSLLSVLKLTQLYCALAHIINLLIVSVAVDCIVEVTLPYSRVSSDHVTLSLLRFL